MTVTNSRTHLSSEPQWWYSIFLDWPLSDKFSIHIMWRSPLEENSVLRKNPRLFVDNGAMLPRCCRAIDVRSDLGAGNKSETNRHGTNQRGRLPSSPTPDTRTRLRSFLFDIKSLDNQVWSVWIAKTAPIRKVLLNDIRWKATFCSKSDREIVFF